MGEGETGGRRITLLLYWTSGLRKKRPFESRSEKAARTRKLFALEAENLERNRPGNCLKVPMTLLKPPQKDGEQGKGSGKYEHMMLHPTNGTGERSRGGGQNKNGGCLPDFYAKRRTILDGERKRAEFG